MTITVRGLLERPRLELTLVGGDSGLDNEITWAHASDLPAPWDYLGPGELLLSNGTGIGSSPDAQVQFIERLARIGASGLVMGLGTGGSPVTSELARRSGDLDLPVLTVPYSIRFSDIVRIVAESNDSHEREQLGDVAQFYDLLRLSLASGSLGRRRSTPSAAGLGSGCIWWTRRPGHRCSTTRTSSRSARCSRAAWPSMTTPSRAWCG